jgi:hypothetical protein
MTIKPFVFGVLVLVIFEGMILGFQKVGIWSVSGKVTRDGQAVQPAAGDVDSIKGWMTLEQVSTAFDVPLQELLVAFNLPVDTPASTALKDMESDTFSVEGLRDWLQSRAQPAQPEGNVEPAQDHPVPMPTAVPTEPAAAPESSEHIAPDRMVTGKTTFQDLLDWGVEQAAIEEVIGGALPPLPTLVKDYVTQQGVPFSEVKSALQAKVDQIQTP